MTLALAASDTISGVAGSATSITYTISGDEVTATGDEFKVLAQGQLGSSAGTLYTVPASTQAIVKSIHLANPTAGAVTAKLTVKGTANANVILPAISIVAGGFAVFGSDGWVFYNSDGQRMGEGATGPQGDPGADGSPGANTIIVEESDGTPSVSDVDTVKFDATGFSVTDNSDGSVTIGNLGGGGGGGGVTQAYLGYNTIGASFEALTANRAYLKKVTISTACFLSSIDLHIKGNASNVWDIGVMVQGDSAGTPTRIIAASRPGINGGPTFFLDATARWFSFGMGVYLPAGDYWFGLQGGSGACSIAYDTGGSDIYYTPGGGYLEDYSLVGSNTNSTRKYSLRLNTLS